MDNIAKGEKPQLLSEYRGYGDKNSLPSTIRRALKKIPGTRYLAKALRGLKVRLLSGDGVKIKRKTLRFEVHICDHCNLNCAGCGHYSPIAEKRFIDPNILERDFKRLSELADRKCELIDLMGGEPLLHPHITEIFDIARKYFDGPVHLVTNGVLLANQPDEFWQSCKKNAIEILISVYPVKINEEKIIAQAQKYGITIIPKDKTFKENSWFKRHVDFTGSQNIKTAYRKCDFGNECLFLEDGKLAACDLPILSRHFNKYFDTSEYKFAEPTEKDYVDIFKVNSLDDIFEKFKHPIPYCRYCTSKFSYPKWEFSKKAINEWV
jgi:organic radical activating enzyme